MQKMANDIQWPTDSGRHRLTESIVRWFASGALRHGPSARSLYRWWIIAHRWICTSNERAAREYAPRSDPPVFEHGKREQASYSLWRYSNRTAYLVSLFSTFSSSYENEWKTCSFVKKKFMLFNWYLELFFKLHLTRLQYFLLAKEIAGNVLPTLKIGSGNSPI